MDLNAVEQYLKVGGSFASIKVLMKKLEMNKKQISRLIMNSTHLRAIEPHRTGSWKKHINVFEYHEYIDTILFFNRQRPKQKKKVVLINPEVLDV